MYECNPSEYNFPHQLFCEKLRSDKNHFKKIHNLVSDENPILGE